MTVDEHPGVECRIMGAATWANDPHEALAVLAGVPSPGDRLSVWTGDEEVYLEVEFVTWPTWQYDHDPGVQAPTVWIRREQDLTDEQWTEVFLAIKERRRP